MLSWVGQALPPRAHRARALFRKRERHQHLLSPQQASEGGVRVPGQLFGAEKFLNASCKSLLCVRLPQVLPQPLGADACKTFQHWWLINH